jgi:hypothetical protein
MSMKRILGLAIAASALASSSATASRIDNIWDWGDHQPTRAEVRSLEAHDPAYLRAHREANDEVKQIYRQLMRQSAG